MTGIGRATGSWRSSLYGPLLDRHITAMPCVASLPVQVTTNAAGSPAFSTFLAQLCGQPAAFFNVGSSSVNPVAFGINVVITLLVATGVRESAFFITGAAQLVLDLRC